ncbi:PREDICTED: uncharacterized protein LOC106338284 [Brassica oleracea var. oleracea]|uniref:uncharacterized protein LOC106338284 n=1 Tax=Brassica oleracea var. oleracea TaxID=109376 RepID=UPI0006A725B5|nr:PREDICTED: uncharacterized protein LOC106338284 [Brassica oleracea var. oleracea]
MGPAKQILGMRIIRDRGEKLIHLSQEKYIEKVLKRFHMNKSKVLSTPLAPHLRLSIQQSPKTYAEKEDMAKVPYASAVGSLMYAMVCTRPDLSYAVGVVSRLGEHDRSHSAVLVSCVHIFPQHIHYSFEIRQIRSHLLLIRHPRPTNLRYLKKILIQISMKDSGEFMVEISNFQSVSEMISKIDKRIIELGEDNMKIKKAMALAVERKAERRRVIEAIKKY